MRIYRWLSLCFFVVLVAGCGREPISLDDFDAAKWKEDRLACKGNREKLSTVLLDQRAKILAHDEIEIVEVLGKPDAHELYKRNEKFYYYYVQPSPQCSAPANDPRRLVIRFNAVGLAKEILIE